MFFSPLSHAGFPLPRSSSSRLPPPVPLLPSSLCSVCECNAEGSQTRFCDRITGKCSCRTGAFGPMCDGCQPGHWGFPNCKSCQCSGLAEDCHQKTGACLNCKGNAAGDNCER